MAEEVIYNAPQDVRIEIRFDPVTKGFSLTGCDENPVVALGALDYALSRVRRFLVQCDLAQEMQNAPRVSLSSRLVE